MKTRWKSSGPALAGSGGMSRRLQDGRLTSGEGDEALERAAGVAEHAGTDGAHLGDRRMVAPGIGLRGTAGLGATRAGHGHSGRISKGVAMIGVGRPRRVFTAAMWRALLALARCRQFQVRMKSTACNEAKARWAASPTASW